MQYTEVQNIAKKTVEFIKEKIQPGMTLLEIRTLCETRMMELGADSFWYWDVGALVFAGDETTLSVSGKEYTTSKRIIEKNDIITIDLSPQNGDTWGDYARTIVIENGKIVESDNVLNEEWKNGLMMEEYLHEEMCKFVTPKTTFEELYYYINSIIEQKGYINLDFMGNLGHSIVRQKSDRVYIEKGNQISLGDVAYFTFEPHISVPNSKYGYKRENIYYFDNEDIKEL